MQLGRRMSVPNLQLFYVANIYAVVTSLSEMCNVSLTLSDKFKWSVYVVLNLNEFDCQRSRYKIVIDVAVFVLKRGDEFKLSNR